VSAVEILSQSLGRQGLSRWWFRCTSAGYTTWAEWADALATRIKAAQAAGDSDVGDTYYHHWLGALEDLLARKGIGSAETARWRDAWQHAANRTPHGTPIELQADDFDAVRNTVAYPQ
jgi:nitrile hydratase accessory protein